ncbi:MAG: hypothetical protein FH748_01445 [Balneolaceae bacterium]|nr:hypothetical protein [Balneolaceae bacterium]
MKFFVSLLLMLVMSSLAVLASDTCPQDKDPKIIIEFYDKYNEVKLGLTDEFVFMEFSSKIREQINKELTEQHIKDVDSFVDSGGEFIISSPTVLRSNRIQYNLEDIEDIEFEKGVLQFEYRQKSDVGFEDIISQDGTKALSSFYVEDLEQFALTYKEYTQP